MVLTFLLNSNARLFPNTKLTQRYWYTAPSHENYAFWWNWQQRPVSPTQPFVLMETALHRHAFLLKTCYPLLRRSTAYFSRVEMPRSTNQSNAPGRNQGTHRNACLRRHESSLPVLSQAFSCVSAFPRSMGRKCAETAAHRLEYVRRSDGFTRSCRIV